MREYLHRKMKTARTLRVFTWLLLPTIGIMGPVILYAPAIAPFYMLFSVFPSCCAYFYIILYRIIYRNVKWLESKGLSHVADDIVPKKPTFPVSSICCGQNALFVRSSFAIIPYAEIAQIRRLKRDVQRTIIGTVVTEKLEVTVKDGKKFPMDVNSDELQPLVELIRPRLVPVSPVPHEAVEGAKN